MNEIVPGLFFKNVLKLISLEEESGIEEKGSLLNLITLGYDCSFLLCTTRILCTLTKSTVISKVCMCSSNGSHKDQETFYGSWLR